MGCSLQSAGLDSPEQILAAIRHKGAKQVIADMTRHGNNDWDRVVKKIETGAPQWLQVASALREGSDAGSTESLQYAVSYSLLESPKLVLPMLGAEFSVAEVCTVPDIEPSSARVTQQVQKAKRALRTVSDPKLQDVREQCLKSFEKLAGK